jgi:hypothetical protein
VLGAGVTNKKLVAELEKELFRLQRKAESLDQRPRWMRGELHEKEVDDLRAEYRRVHERWKAAKAQTTLDV